MENYTTIEDLADRWDTAQAARQHGPAAMRFQDWGEWIYGRDIRLCGNEALSSGSGLYKDLLQSHPAAVIGPAWGRVGHKGSPLHTHRGGVFFFCWVVNPDTIVLEPELLAHRYRQYKVIGFYRHKRFFRGSGGCWLSEYA